MGRYADMETNPAIKREITAFMDGLRKRNKGETEIGRAHV